MITIFTVPKPFQDEHIKIIQLNAIRSWKLLKPCCEVILLGKDKGVAEAAESLKVKHIPDIEYSWNNTPILSSVFALAKKYSKNHILIFINSDIILPENFIEAVLKIKKENFLAIGQRIDVDINDIIDYKNFEKKSISILAENGELHDVSAVDYFVFTKDLFNFMPPFLIGRAGYDNWMIFDAKTKKIPVIDLSLSAIAIHQNHAYSHCQGGRKEAYEGAEAIENYKLAKNKFYYIWHADYALLKSGELKTRAFCSLKHFKQYFFNVLPDYLPIFKKIVKPLQKFKHYLYLKIYGS